MWDLLLNFQHTDFSTWLREGDFVSPFSVYYTMLGFHSIGMAAVVGICWMLSFRIFGYFEDVSLPKANDLMVIAWWGFYINLASGIVLLMAQPLRELLTPTFDIKMIMIVFGVIGIRNIQQSLNKIEVATLADGSTAEVIPAGVRVMALWTSFAWLAAIIAGRLIGYVQPPPIH